MMPTIHYRIPDLLSVCPPRSNRTVNRHLECVDADFMSWVGDCSLFSKSQKKSWKDAHMSYLVAHALPYASEAQLRVSTDLLCLTIILDDLTAAASTVETQKLVDMYISLFQNRGAPGARISSTDDDTRLAKALNELVTHAFETLDPFYHSRIIAAHISFAQSCLQEAKDREKPADAMTLGSYVSTRRASIGVEAFLILTQWSRGIVLLDEVSENGMLLEMAKATADMVFLANDIYSYKKEYLEDGAPHNIVTVTMRDPLATKRFGLQESFDHATELFKAALSRFEACMSRLPSFGGDIDLQVGRYIEGMMDWVVGNILWSESNLRYAVFENEKSRKSRMVTLQSKAS